MHASSSADNVQVIRQPTGGHNNIYRCVSAIFDHTLDLVSEFGLAILLVLRPARASWNEPSLARKFSDLFYCRILECGRLLTARKKFPTIARYRQGINLTLDAMAQNLIGIHTERFDPLPSDAYPPVRSVAELVAVRVCVTVFREHSSQPAKTDRWEFGNVRTR